VTRLDCPYEADVLMVVTTGQWPDRAPAELREHAATCSLCADVALIAQVIEEDADWIRGRSNNNDEASMPAPPQLPSAGTVWWRAQLRARQDAAKTVGRPITVAQGALLAVVGGVAGAVFGATTGWFQSVLQRGWGGIKVAASTIHLPALPSFSVDTTGLADYRAGFIIVGIGAALAMAVVMWALREDRT
jgi:hypothetical protein